MERKNWLFIGEAEAGERGAIFFTLIEACRSRGIDPREYLQEVLTRLPSMTNHQIKVVIPAAWAKAHLQKGGRIKLLEQDRDPRAA